MSVGAGSKAEAVLSAFLPGSPASSLEPRPLAPSLPAAPPPRSVPGAGAETGLVRVRHSGRTETETARSRRDSFPVSRRAWFVL